MPLSGEKVGRTAARLSWQIGKQVFGSAGSFILVQIDCYSGNRKTSSGNYLFYNVQLRYSYGLGRLYLKVFNCIDIQYTKTIS